MCVDPYTTQARRLQSFLKSNPAQASALAEGKFSACLDAVAALNGTRNWNTLRARALRERAVGPASHSNSSGQVAPVPDGPLRPGDVEYIYGRSGSGKSLGTLSRVSQAVTAGYRVTALDIDSTWADAAFEGSQKLRMGDAVGSPEAWSRAPVVTIEFGSWSFDERRPGSQQSDRPRAMLTFLNQLETRTGPGSVVVIDELWSLLEGFGERLPLLLAFLASARERGTALIFIAQARKDFEPIETHLPPTQVFEYQWVKGQSTKIEHRQTQAL